MKKSYNLQYTLLNDWHEESADEIRAKLLRGVTTYTSLKEVTIYTKIHLLQKWWYVKTKWKQNTDTKKPNTYFLLVHHILGKFSAPEFSCHCLEWRWEERCCQKAPFHFQLNMDTAQKFECNYTCIFDRQFMARY